MSQDAPAAELRPSGGSLRRAGLPVIALVVLISLLAASSVALLLVLRSARGDRAESARSRDRAATAAGQLMVNLDALSAATIEADMARVVAGSTGTFKKQFTGSQEQLKSYIKKQRISSKGELRSVAVLRSDSDTATVLVAIDRTFKDATHPKGLVANDRWKVSLEKHGGRWLAAELEPVA